MTPALWRAGLFNRERERGYLIWCRRRDLNPHGLRHTPLKRACLPFHHFGTPQELEKPPQLRSRVAQTLNVEEEFLGGRKHCRGFSVRQDPLQGRTAHTKCGLYLLGISLAADLLQGFLKLLQLGILEQTVTLFRARVSRFTNDAPEGAAL